MLAIRKLEEKEAVVPYTLNRNNERLEFLGDFLSIGVGKVLRLDVGKFKLKWRSYGWLSYSTRGRLDELLRVLPALLFSDSLIEPHVFIPFIITISTSATENVCTSVAGQKMWYFSHSVQAYCHEFSNLFQHG